MKQYPTSFLLITFCFFATIQKSVFGVECDEPIKCLNSKEFVFCSKIKSNERIDEKIHECPENYECVRDRFFPCVKAYSETTTIPTTTLTASINSDTNPQCKDSKDAGNFPAPDCNQYYSCESFLFWWNLTLKNCGKNKAFDPASAKCVAKENTTCNS